MDIQESTTPYFNKAAALNLTRTHSAHLLAKHENENAAQKQSKVDASSFSSLLKSSLSKVSQLENNAEALTVQAAINPESVNPHDVTIASAKASLALNMTKSILERAVQAYRTLSTLR